MRPLTSFTVLIALSNHASQVAAFTHPAVNCRMNTQLYLENNIADMIDKEVERLKDIGKPKALNAKEPTLPDGFDFNSVNEFQPNVDAANKIQMRKDKRMARDDPMRYCADRCVSTGNCEVWEDMFELSAIEVQKFCTECVLSEEEEPCDVPDKFIEDAGKQPWELSTVRP